MKCSCAQKPRYITSWRLRSWKEINWCTQDCVEGGPLGGGRLQQHQSLRRGQIERILQQQLAIDRRFRTEHSTTHAASFAATLASTALESADAAIAGTTGIASFDDDVASGEARFALELDGIRNLEDDRRTDSQESCCPRALYRRDKLLNHGTCRLDFEDVLD